MFKAQKNLPNYDEFEVVLIGCLEWDWGTRFENEEDAAEVASRLNAEAAAKAAELIADGEYYEYQKAVALRLAELQVAWSYV